MKRILVDRRTRRLRSIAPRRDWTPSMPAMASATIASLVAMAAVNWYLAAKAEERNPPTGNFVEVNGVRLHHIERGSGDPIILLHGNGSMVQDFECSGLIDLAAKDHRVIAFDRPGFGYSERPRNVVWTPDAQAELIRTALERIGISKAIILGHSWGASVAVALALRYPWLVRGLVLASGYYYPTPRIDAVASFASSFPLVGDILSYTVSPLFGRLAWPQLMAKIFGPLSPPAKFAAFPKEMALRPSQLRASAVESVLMVPDALLMRGHYPELKMPVVIIAGEQDKLVDIETQSARLHVDIPHSSFHRVAGNGHMIQQTATAEVMFALREVADKATAIAAD